jgi:hypothetical protein
MILRKLNKEKKESERKTPVRDKINVEKRHSIRSRSTSLSASFFFTGMK